MWSFIPDTRHQRPIQLTQWRISESTKYCQAMCRMRFSSLKWGTLPMLIWRACWRKSQFVRLSKRVSQPRELMSATIMLLYASHSLNPSIHSARGTKWTNPRAKMDSISMLRSSPQSACLMVTQSILHMRGCAWSMRCLYRETSLNKIQAGPPLDFLTLMRCSLTASKFKITAHIRQ